MLRGQNRGEIARALLIFEHCDVQRALRFTHAAAQITGLGRREKIGRDSVFDLFLSLQHPALIIDQILLQRRILQPHIICDLAVIQQVPSERGPNREHASDRVQHLRKVVTPTLLACPPKTPLMLIAG